MIRWMARTAAVVSVAMVVAGLVSCGSDVRNDPFIIQSFQEIRSQLDKTKDLPGKVAELNSTVASLQDEISRLRGVGGATSTPLAMASQVAMLRQALNAIDARLAAVEAQLRTRPPVATPGPVRTPAPALTPPPTTPKAPIPVVPRTIPGPVTTGTKQGVKPGVPVAKTPRLIEPATASRGGYYTAVNGDTLQSVAARFKVPVDDILKANTFLKPDSALIPGDRVWIPAPGK